MAKTLTIIDFMQKFSSEESCKTYLADQKWVDGFVCRVELFVSIQGIAGDALPDVSDDVLPLESGIYD